MKLAPFSSRIDERLPAVKVAETLDVKIRALPSVQSTKSRWGHQTAYVIGEREFAHFHRQNEIDVRLTRAVQRKMRVDLREDPRVKLRPGSSDWITITLATEEDLDFAFELVKQARNANRR